MMNRRNALQLMLASSVSIAALSKAAFAEMAPAIDQPITISFYDYNLASAGLGADATNELIANFTKANPKVTVNPIGVASNQILARVQADIVAGQQPDVAQMVFRDMIYIAEDLGAVALEDIATPDELKELFDGMLPAGLELGRIDGKTYGLAYTFSTPILYINATLFKAAGLDPDQPPKTWADVKAAALAIQDKTGKAGFFAGAYGPADGTFVYQAILMSNGGKVRDGDTLTFASPEGIEAVKMLRNLTDSGAQPHLDVASPSDVMAAGNLGMFLYTSAVQSTYSKSSAGKWDLRVAPMPSFGDKPTAPTNSGSALFILSKDPIKQRASFELLKSLTSKEGYTIITSKIGYLPLRLDIVDDPNYLGPWTKEHPLIRPNLEQLARLTPNVAFGGPNYRQVENMMKDAMVQAVFGKDDVTQVLTTAQTNAQALYIQG